MNGTTQEAVKTFEEFTAEVREKLQEYYSGCEVKTVNTDKNNGIRLTGVSIRPKGSNTAPAIYLDDLYKEYLDGCPMGHILSHITGLYGRCVPDSDITIPDVIDFGAVRDLICCRLVNYGSNRERLREMPHRPFLNLAVTYYIPISVRGHFDSRITVTDALMERWGVKEETLYQHALTNTRRLFPTELKPLGEIFREALTGLPRGHPPMPVQTPMHILRCGGKGGAAAMLFEPVLRGFADRYGDFYIFPSSVSEVILLPVSAGYLERGSACSIVREVNQGYVAPDEVLSDTPYLYHADTGAIEILW